MWDGEKCDFCGDCLVRCQYVDYDKDKAVQQIKELMDGKPAEIIKDCVTCWSGVMIQSRPSLFV
jgi:coenzyme F420-reducing hydrogenase beta subunit